MHRSGRSKWMNEHNCILSYEYKDLWVISGLKPSGRLDEKCLQAPIYNYNRHLLRDSDLTQDTESVLLDMQEIRPREIEYI